jgi:hypothetical protein
VVVVVVVVVVVRLVCLSYPKILLGFLQPISLILISITIVTDFRIGTLQTVHYGRQHLDASSVNNLCEVKINLFVADSVGFLQHNKQTRNFSNFNVRNASRHSLLASFPLLSMEFVMIRPNALLGAYIDNQ